jgi:hypothetical protein
LFINYFIYTVSLFELFKTPLDKAKSVLEELIKLSLDVNIDAYEAKLARIVYATDPFELTFKHLITYYETLAHCLLRNNWDTHKIFETLKNDCKSNFPHLHLNNMKNMTPSFDFDRMSSANLSSCKNISSYSPIYVYSGIFKANNAKKFTPKTWWDVPVERIKAIADAIDFHAVYLEYIQEYWNKNSENYTHYMGQAALEAVIHQVKEKSLSEKGAIIAISAILGSKDVQVYPLGLYKSKPRNFISVFHASKEVFAIDIFCIRNTSSNHVILYFNGNSSPFHEFKDMSELSKWFINVTNNETKRKKLLSHFLSSDIEGNWYSNDLEYDLIKYSTKKNANTNNILHFGEPLPSKDMVKTLTNGIREKSLKELPAMVKSNRLSSEPFLGLEMFNIAFLPILILFPELIPLELGLIMGDMVKSEKTEIMERRRKRLEFGHFNSEPKNYKKFATESEKAVFLNTIKKIFGDEHENFNNIKSKIVDLYVN